MMTSTRTTDSRPLIILVGSGYHLYREYLLSSVAEAARVWLFTTAEPTWEVRYIVGHTVVDTLDSWAMIAAANELTDRIQVSGVLCWDEVRMVRSAELAQALGLPGGQPDAVGRCRDKHLTRRALDAAEVPQARSRAVSDVAAARQAALEFGYPVVLKPRALGASFGVVKVQSDDELEAGYRQAREATEDGVPHYEVGVLVEEFLAGPEISVDSAVVDGVLAPLFVARKVTGFPPYCEEVGHVVDAADPLLTDPAVLRVLERAHDAVGFVNGITHTEVMLTAAGPKIVEINARLGGDLIPFVASVANGIDIGRVAVQVTLGEYPDVPLPRSRVAAVRFFYPPADLTVAEVEIDETALPTAVDTAGVLASAGQRLELPPVGHVTSRYAYVVVAGESADLCAEAAESASAAITLRTADDLAITR